jgi:hypothetical protein
MSPFIFYSTSCQLALGELHITYYGKLNTNIIFPGYLVFMGINIHSFIDPVVFKKEKTCMKFRSSHPLSSPIPIQMIGPSLNFVLYSKAPSACGWHTLLYFLHLRAHSPSPSPNAGIAIIQKNITSSETFCINYRHVWGF